MRILTIAATSALFACVATTASSIAAPVTGAKAAAIMHARHEGMEAVGDTNKELRRQLTSSSPDIGAVRAAAGKLAGLAKQSSGWFAAGTGPDVGKTGAKAEIWTNPKDFASKLGAFQHAAVAFNAAAASGNSDAIKARYADLGGTCKACHDTYRAEMHH